MARSTRSRGLVLRQAVALAEKRCTYSETCTLALMFWQLLLRPGSWMGAVKQEYLRHHVAAARSSDWLWFCRAQRSHTDTRSQG